MIVQALIIIIFLIYVVDSIRVNRANPRKIAIDIAKLLLPALAILMLFTQILGITIIRSGSMEPTLMTGNTVFLNRIAYKTGNTPERGDIVSFYSDELGVILGKRIIGIPGDHIEFKDGFVYINNQKIDESAYLDTSVAKTYCEFSFDVPTGCYFMLGDNRENSNDSRFWQNPYIPLNKIIGKYIWQLNFHIGF